MGRGPKALGKGGWRPWGRGARGLEERGAEGLEKRGAKGPGKGGPEALRKGGLKALRKEGQRPWGRGQRPWVNLGQRPRGPVISSAKGRSSHWLIPNVSNDNTSAEIMTHSHVYCNNPKSNESEGAPPLGPLRLISK